MERFVITIILLFYLVTKLEVKQEVLKEEYREKLLFIKEVF